MRLVIDTNVFISGIFWEGNYCSQLIDKWRAGLFELVTSIDIIEELVETLKSFKILLPEDIIYGWKRLIIENSLIIELPDKLDLVKEDPDDNKFIEAAVSADADYLITQDNHLLKIKEYENVKIIKPEEAIRLFD